MAKETHWHKNQLTRGENRHLPRRFMVPAYIFRKGLKHKMSVEQTFGLVWFLFWYFCSSSGD